MAGRLAVQHGWALNLGGGFHHCSADKGEGFCIYADITLLIKVHCALYVLYNYYTHSICGLLKKGKASSQSLNLNFRTRKGFTKIGKVM